MGERARAVGFISMWAITVSACTSAPRIVVVDDLVAQLRNAGIRIDTQGPAPRPTGQYFRFDEGVRVKGPNLFLDILRIEDRHVFDIAKSAGAILALADASAAQPIPDNPAVYARHPFVVIVREQPEAAGLHGTLAKLLPPEQQ